MLGHRLASYGKESGQFGGCGGAIGKVPEHLAAGWVREGGEYIHYAKVGGTITIS